MPESENDQEEPDWVNVARFTDLDEAHENALVALSMGEAICVDHGELPGEYQLRTEPQAAPRVTEQLQEYAAESMAFTPPLPLVSSRWAHHPAGIVHYLLWAAVLITCFRMQGVDPSWTERGASSSIALITQAEWWRPFTALFLHGDGGHLLSNLVSSAFFGALVSKCIGPWKGWILTLAAGTLGNVITSFITYPESFISLGASTAVFGSLGILSGIGFVENFREKLRMPWLRVIAPLLAGVILLGWLGGAQVGSRVDVFGHVFGYTSGVILGACFLYLETPVSQQSVAR